GTIFARISKYAGLELIYCPNSNRRPSQSVRNLRSAQDRWSVSDSPQGKARSAAAIRPPAPFLQESQNMRASS
ncbi:MAG: hypothetical protein WD397_03380, partial [Wenzhouxiangellaceae bacterium]